MWDELQESIRATLDSRQIGTLVAVRIFAAVPDLAGDPPALLWQISRIAAPALTGSGTLRVQADPDRRQWSVLLAPADGKTVSLTLVLGTSPPALQLLLVGNCGVARLEGGELIGAPPLAGDIPQEWQAAVEESLRTGGTVALDSSSLPVR